MENYYWGLQSHSGSWNELHFDVLKKEKNWQNHEISCWNLAPFLLEAAEASLCYFFENWLMKFKILNLVNPLCTIIQWNYWSFYPSELIHFAHFNVRYPVVWIRKKFSRQITKCSSGLCHLFFLFCILYS